MSGPTSLSCGLLCSEQVLIDLIMRGSFNPVAVGVGAKVREVYHMAY